MNSSRGRPPLHPTATANNTSISSSTTSTKKKKTFVFGSSTPRELSHIEKVTRKARLIDGSQISREPENQDERKGPGISYYMRQARSITPAGGRGDHTSSWAFGSSTPREFSHLKNIRSDQRIYDAKIVHKPEAKSITTSLISEKSVKPATLLKPQTSSGGRIGNHVTKKSGRLSDADDASSEPDMVQDRAIDFHRNTARKPTKKAVEIPAVKSVQKPANNANKVAKDDKKPETTKEVPKRQKSLKKVEETTKKESKPTTPKKSAVIEKKGKLEKKSSQDEKFHELATEIRQKVVLVNQTHEHASNEKAVHIPTVLAHDDASEVLLDDQEITAIVAKQAEHKTLSSETVSPRKSGTNSSAITNNILLETNNATNETNRSSSPLQENTPDSPES